MKPSRAVLPAIVIAAVLAAGCGSSSITIHGSMSIVAATYPGSDCDLSDTGYSDITPGTQVTVTAPDGTVLGSGALGKVKARASGVDCEFPFTITGVKGGEARYGVAISHRGTVWFTPKEIATAALEINGADG